MRDRVKFYTLVSWSLTSLFSTNMATSETKISYVNSIFTISACDENSVCQAANSELKVGPVKQSAQSLTLNATVTCRAKLLPLKLCRYTALTAVYWLMLRSALSQRSCREQAKLVGMNGHA